MSTVKIMSICQQCKQFIVGCYHHIWWCFLVGKDRFQKLWVTALWKSVQVPLFRTYSMFFGCRSVFYFLELKFIFLCWTCPIVGAHCAWQPAGNSLKLAFSPKSCPTQIPQQVQTKPKYKYETWNAMAILKTQNIIHVASHKNTKLDWKVQFKCLAHIPDQVQIKPNYKYEM